MNNLIIQLDNPIEVGHKGSLVSIELITIRPCSVLNFNIFADVKEVVTKSLFEFKQIVGDQPLEDEEEQPLESEGEQGESKVELAEDKDALLPLDMFASTGHLKELQKVINKYLISNCTFDDEIKITELYLQRLTMKEYTNLLERVSYFLYKS